MKQLITSVACTMLLLAFVMQFAQNQVLHSRLSMAELAVNGFREVVRREGCVSRENADRLRDRLCEILDCAPEAVTISGPAVPVARGQWIEYTVAAPVRDIVAVPAFWEIAAQDNGYLCTFRQQTVSGYVGDVPGTTGAGSGGLGGGPGSRVTDRDGGGS